MSDPSRVSVNRPRRGQSIGVGGTSPAEPRPIQEPPAPGNPLDWYPGENPDAPSPQAQSWIDAGQGIKDFFGGISDWYGRNIYPYTPGAAIEKGMDGSNGTEEISALMAKQGYYGAPQEQLFPTEGNIGSFINKNTPFPLLDDQRDRRGSTLLRGQKDKIPADTPAEDTQSATDWLQIALNYLGGGPDYGAYREAVTGQASDLNAQIQAMYKQLAESAGQNAKQIQGTYDTAIQGIGTGYDTAAQNVNDAYLSGQQQAADQMARLGIEAAAPAILPTQALAQGQAISNLEQGRGSGLAAANRYGATAGGFGQQMAQVAQQQGVEQNASLLNSLQRRLSDSLLQETQDEYQNRLRAPGVAQELYGTTQIGMPAAPTIDQQLKAQQIELDLRSNDLRAQQDAQQAQTDLIVQLGTQPGGTVDVEQGLAAYEALVAALAG